MASNQKLDIAGVKEWWLRKTAQGAVFAYTAPFATTDELVRVINPGVTTDYAKALAEFLTWMARPGEGGFNAQTCEQLNCAAELLNPKVERKFTVVKPKEDDELPTL